MKQSKKRPKATKPQPAMPWAGFAERESLQDLQMQFELENPLPSPTAEQRAGSRSKAAKKLRGIRSVEKKTVKLSKAAERAVEKAKHDPVFKRGTVETSLMRQLVTGRQPEESTMDEFKPPFNGRGLPFPTDAQAQADEELEELLWSRGTLPKPEPDKK